MTDTLLGSRDGLLLDLDGTIFRGGVAVPGAVDAVRRAERQGVGVRYVTNNASRGPSDVVAQLIDLGFPARAEQVSTSAQAAAAMLVGRVDRGAEVLVVGTDALRDEVARYGLVPVREAGPGTDAVVQGHSPDTAWADLAEACLAIRAGAVWVACNVDSTLPTERGQLPGNGAMVSALTAATGSRPAVAGKPERPLFDRAAESAGFCQPLVVGDRLETDVAGGARAGMPVLCVLTGVSTPADLLGAPAECRPDYVAADLSALHAPAEWSVVRDQPEWKARHDGAVLILAKVTASSTSGQGGPEQQLGALRALCAAWWPCGEGTVGVRAEDSDADRAVRDLGLLPA